jgi:hypothetical protein
VSRRRASSGAGAQPAVIGVIETVVGRGPFSSIGPKVVNGCQWPVPPPAARPASSDRIDKRHDASGAQIGRHVFSGGRTIWASRRPNTIATRLAHKPASQPDQPGQESMERALADGGESLLRPMAGRPLDSAGFGFTKNAGGCACSCSCRRREIVRHYGDCNKISLRAARKSTAGPARGSELAERASSTGD